MRTQVASPNPGTVHVSVVLPTVLRPELSRAIESVRRQNVPSELILVVDGPWTCAIDAWKDRCDRLLVTGKRKGSAFARNLGVSTATAPWVAFLDDDDEWAPDKLERQLASANAEGTCRYPVVSSRAVHRWAAFPDDTSRPVPSRLYRGDEAVADYLFVNRGPVVGRPSIFLPTVLAPTELVRLVPFREDLRRHVDWDWIIRAHGHPGVRIRQLPESLCSVTVGSSGSLSAASDWRGSLEFAIGVRSLISKKAYKDFLAGQVLRFALQARSPAGVRAVTNELVHCGLPSLRALALGLSGVVSRSQAERRMRQAALGWRGRRQRATALTPREAG
jgi:glycosyltransferase involved in cell wall biosynthesis